MKNYLHILGLNEGASQDEIEEAYDRLKKELDPKKNGNQDFFVEEFKKINEAYSALKNSSILSNGVDQKRTIFNSNNSADPSEINIDKTLISKKINMSNWFINYKKHIFVFILMTLLLKILVHFFIFPTKKTILNTDKKVFVQITDIGDRLNIKRGLGKVDDKGNKLIVFGDNYFYYPKEQKKDSIAEHITMTFTQKTWIFPIIIILIIFIVWLNLEKSEVDRSDSKNKHKISCYFSKINLTILTLTLLIAYNYYLQNQIESLSNSIIKAADSSQETANNINRDSKNMSTDSQDQLKTIEEYMNNTEEYMNTTEEYMNNAEIYMNNAAQSAQDAEEYSTSQ